jgi:putative aldouronate transport system permease protein
MRLIKRQLRHITIEDVLIDAFVWITMIMVVIVTVYPFWYVTVLAFNDALDASLGGVFFWPRKFSLDNFKKLLGDNDWANAIFISVARTVIGTIFGLIATSLVAFAFSSEKLMGKKMYYRIFILTMYFSGGMIPFYVLLRSIHMLNTFWVYVVPGALNVFYMLIMINFYREIPASLFESAALDGAGDFRQYIHIALPLSKAPLATIALFFAVNQWNSWIDSVYYVQKASLRPMAYLMMEVINKSASMTTFNPQLAVSSAANAISTTTTSLQMAAMVLAVFPILAVYPFLQKYFVKGVMIGSVKG